MNLVEWLKKQREKKYLRMEELAEASGVDRSSISRIENEHTQPTFATVIRLFKGLDATASDIAELIGIPEEKVQQFVYSTEIDTPQAINWLEAVQVVEQYRLKTDELCSWIAELLNVLEKQRRVKDDDASPHFPAFAVSEVHRMIVGSYLVSNEIEYPDAVSADYYLDWFNRGGTMTFTDAGTYVKTVRSAKGLNQQDMLQAGFRSRPVISRIETGNVERLKFGDILLIDRFLDADGDILGMYWRAVNIQIQLEKYNLIDFTMSEGWEISGYELVTFFMTLWHWIELGDESDHWRSIMKERLANNWIDY